MGFYHQIGWGFLYLFPSSNSMILKIRVLDHIRSVSVNISFLEILHVLDT